jgi:hypothetical protein
MTPKNWRLLVVRDAGMGHRAEPKWSPDGVPMCDEMCQYHDGKRCELLGLRPGNICEPVVAAMAGLLAKCDYDHLAFRECSTCRSPLADSDVEPDGTCRYCGSFSALHEGNDP